MKLVAVATGGIGAAAMIAGSPALTGDEVAADAGAVVPVAITAAGVLGPTAATAAGVVAGMAGVEVAGVLLAGVLAG